MSVPTQYPEGLVLRASGEVYQQRKPHLRRIPRRKVSHNDVIQVEGATLRVIFRPGHAENHATFILEEERALFSGDHVFGYGTTAMQDLYEYMASIEAMVLYEPLELHPGREPHIVAGYGPTGQYYCGGAELL